MVELKPCPFCGSEAQYEFHCDDYNRDYVVCQNEDCGAMLTRSPHTGAMLWTISREIVDAWNRRWAESEAEK